MSAKPELSAILASLKAKGKPKAKPLVLTPRKPEGAMPLLEGLNDLLPAPTAFEKAMDKAMAAPALPASRGPNPRLPWIGRGEMQKLAKVPAQERVKLHNAMAKAKAGKRLTLKERRLLGKHELSRIMGGLRRKVGDNG